MQQQSLARPLALVCIVAPEDAVLLTQWEAHLQPLQQAGLISVWSELHLAPGASMQEWQDHVHAADLVILLLSASFFASLGCLTKMEAVLQRSQTSALRVIPLLLQPVAWQESPLASLIPWPVNEQPIMLWSNQEEGWYSCVQELRRLLGRRISEAAFSQPSSKHADPDWERMLRRLRRSYKELLNQSLQDLAWAELGLATRLDLVSNVTNLLFRLPQGGERLLAPGTSILDSYDEAEGELLILGAPGAGKSTLLLDLAQQLVKRALADEIQVLPVVLRLSSWAVGRPALAGWMVKQLSRTYDVPPQLSERWVQQGRLLPLLDGLDEMEEAARPACVEAINGYHQTHLNPLVVCSRYAEYEAITKEGAKSTHLALQNAVIIKPLSNGQIEEYLSHAGPSFAGMRVALHQQKALWELATTPLMLSVLLLTYRDTSTHAILKQGMDLERQVWTDYVKRMVQEKGNEAHYSLEKTYAWLSFLAQQMQTHQQTTFYAEHLYIDWLAKTQQKSATRLTILIPSIVIGVCVSLLVVNFISYSGEVFLLPMGVLGGFIGACLSPPVVEAPAARARQIQVTMTRHLRNAVLLGVLLITGFSLSFDLGYRVSDWRILGVGSILSGWAFQVLIDRLPKQTGPVARNRLRGHLAAWMSALGSLHFWRAVAILGIGIGLSVVLNVGLSVELNVGLIYGLSMSVTVSVTIVLVRLILDASLRTLRFAERIHWTWYGLFQPKHLRMVVIGTAMASLFYMLSYVLIAGLSSGLSYWLGYELIHGLSAGLSVGFSLGFIYWLLVGLYQSLKQEHLEDQNRSQFNQGIRHSSRNGLLVSLISTIIILVTNILSSGLNAGLIVALNYGMSRALHYGMGYGLSSGLNYGLDYGLILALDAALSSGLNFGLSFGPSVLVAGIVVMWALSGGPTVLRHYVIRWLLAHSQTFPWRAQAFLDDATNRILLRRVGGGYSFIHRRLQDYFVDAVTPP